MKRRNRDANHRKKRAEDKPEIFSMTQEDSVVTWDESDHPTFTVNNGGGNHQDHEIFDIEYDDDGENSNSSFMWKELEQKNKRRRATTPAPSATSSSLPLPILPSTVSFLVDSTDTTKQTSSQYHESISVQERVIANEERPVSISRVTSSVQETASTLESKQTKDSQFIDIQNNGNIAPNQATSNAFEVEISEDDFERIEQEILSKQQVHPMPGLPLPVFQQPLNSQSISSVSFQTEAIQDIDNSQAYIDLMDEIERQAAEQASQRLTTGGTAMQSHVTMESYIHHQPVTFPSHGMSLHLPEFACIRLVAAEVEDHNSVHRKIIHATIYKNGKAQQQMTMLGHTKIFVELCDDWYYSAIERGDIFHIINVGSQLLDDGHKDSSNSIIKLHSPTETRIVINNQHGLLALCPDVLISPTKVAESCTCTRRGVLSDRIRSFGMSAASAVMGNVRHAFIEELTEKVLNAINELGNPSFSAQDIMNKIPKPVVNQIALKAIQEHVEDLYCIHKTDEEIFKDLYAIIPPTMTWITMCAKEGTLALTVKHAAHANITNDLYKEVSDYTINDIIGIEESICSPVLGIKGQIDMIAGGSISKISGHTIAQTNRDDLVTVPIEFKTGKWRQSTAIAHRAQVILYILLMMMRRSTMRSIEENNGSVIRSSVSSYGLVLYISDRDQKVDFIKPLWHEIKDLMMSRNSLAKSIFSSTHSNNSTIMDSAYSTEDGSSLALLRTPSQALGSSSVPIVFDNNYLSSNQKNGTITRLPPMLKSDHECSYCYSASECLMYHASIENGNDVSSGISMQFNYVLKGISHKHIQYLKHWDHLIDLESIVNEDSIQRLWSMTGPDREKCGAKSMGRLTMTSVSSSNSLMKVHSVSNGGVSTVGNGTNDRNLLICLSRPDDALEDSPFMVGDRVLVSIEQLSTNKDAENNPQQTQIFSKVLNAINANICSGAIQIITKDTIEIMIVQGHRSILSLQKIDEQKMTAAGWFFRIDKDDSNVNISTMRSNLMELFVEPFNPTMYSDAKKPLSRANSLNNALESLPVNQAMLEKSVKSAFSRQRVRELIVDLREPKFRNIPGPLNFAVQPNRTVTKNFSASTSSLANLKANLVEMDYEIMYHLFCPSAMDKKVFQFAMKALMIMTAVGEDNSIQIQPGRPSVNGNNSLQMSLKDVNLLQGGDGHFIITPSEIVVYPGCHPLQLYQEYLLLNPGQREALHKVLFCEDYVLLWGLPGTGKTYTLALIVRMIVSRQETVLLTSYTHNAVDHIMEKLMGKGMNTQHVMRINSSSAPSSTVNTESPHLSNPSMGLIAAFKKRISSVRVFVATILAVSRHVLFKSQHIHCSYCVIDEAGQITTPVILAGLMHSHKFILSGDDYQLPPLILSQEAAKKGMAVSLLKQLMSMHPHAVSTLYIQYRMNDSIMSLCNRLVYEDRMLCGTAEVANRRLLLPSIHSLPMPFGASQPADVTERTDWLFQALSPHNPVVMLNTDALPSLEKYSLNDLNSISGSSVENISDGLIIKALLIGLLDYCQLAVTNDIAIITPFRAQMTLLQQLLHTTVSSTTDNNNGNNGNMALLKRYVLHSNNYDISTVDKYQGKDRDVVIFNTVKKIKNLSNTNSINENEGSVPVDSVGTLLRDWRRINVALTRAKQKLIIIGSKTMMQEEPVLKALSDFMVERNWMVDLLPNALQAYRFERSSNSATSNAFQEASMIGNVGSRKEKRDATEISSSSQEIFPPKQTIHSDTTTKGPSSSVAPSTKRIRVEYDHSSSEPVKHPTSLQGPVVQQHAGDGVFLPMNSIPRSTVTTVRNDGNGVEINVVRNIPVPAGPPLSKVHAPVMMTAPPPYGSKMVPGTLVNPFSGPARTVVGPSAPDVQKSLQRAVSLPLQTMGRGNGTSTQILSSQPLNRPQTNLHPAYGKQLQPGTAFLPSQQQQQPPQLGNRRPPM